MTRRSTTRPPLERPPVRARDRRESGAPGRASQDPEVVGLGAEVVYGDLCGLLAREVTARVQGRCALATPTSPLPAAGPRSPRPTPPPPPQVERRQVRVGGHGRRYLRVPRKRPRNPGVDPGGDEVADERDLETVDVERPPALAARSLSSDTLWSRWAFADAARSNTTRLSRSRSPHRRRLNAPRRTRSRPPARTRAAAVSGRVPCRRHRPGASCSARGCAPKIFQAHGLRGFTSLPSAGRRWPRRARQRTTGWVAGM